MQVQIPLGSPSFEETQQNIMPVSLIGPKLRMQLVPKRSRPRLNSAPEAKGSTNNARQRTHSQNAPGSAMETADQSMRAWGLIKTAKFWFIAQSVLDPGRGQPTPPPTFLSPPPTSVPKTFQLYDNGQKNDQKTSFHEAERGKQN